MSFNKQGKDMAFDHRKPLVDHAGGVVSVASCVPDYLMGKLKIEK